MRRAYKDNTSDTAIDSVNKEWRDMAKLAVYIREGRAKPSWVEEQEKKFTGIFKRLLVDPIEEVMKETGR